MPRSTAGLLAAVGTAASGLVGLVHGGQSWAALGSAAVLAGVLSYLLSPSTSGEKKWLQRNAQRCRNHT